MASRSPRRLKASFPPSPTPMPARPSRVTGGKRNRAGIAVRSSLDLIECREHLGGGDLHLADLVQRVVDTSGAEQPRSLPAVAMHGFMRLLQLAECRIAGKTPAAFAVIPLAEPARVMIGQFARLELQPADGHVDQPLLPDH